MSDASRKILAILLAFFALIPAEQLFAELIPVRHSEGMSLGFLVVRDPDGRVIAYGKLKQVLKEGIVTDDLLFHFKDGSFYQEVTKFTQHRAFRLVSDYVVQKGPSFKQDTETWIDACRGSVRVQSSEDGKSKLTDKNLQLPAQAARHYCRAREARLRTLRPSGRH